MFGLKHPLRSFAPTRANGALVPAALALLLLASAGVQIVLPRATDMPDAALAGRAPQWRLPDIATPAPPTDANLSLFAPARMGQVAAKPNAEGAKAPPPPGPLGETSVIGRMRLGASRVVLLREHDGRVLHLVPGSSYRGWRLVGSDETGARLRRGRETLAVPYSAKPPAAPAPQTDDSENASE